MPGFYQAGEYDLAGFCVGVVEKDEIIDGQKIAPGDVLIGLESSGPHSNGFSLIRRIIDRQGGELSEDLVRQLLAPTRIYVKSVRAAMRQISVHGGVHVTGGGFFENVPRMLTRPEHAALIDTDQWQWPSVFAWLQQAGNVAEQEMLATFNCGIGFILCVPERDAAKAIEALAAEGERAHQIGRIVPADTQPSGPNQLLITA